MTDLSRSEIEWVREDGPSVVTNGAFQTLCDMALAKKDAEAECERLRRSLQNVMVHTGHTKTSPDRLHMELLDHIAQIVSNALATPPPEGDPCDVCGGEGRRALPNATNTIVHHPFCTACKGTGKVPHTPEQAHGDALAAFKRRAEDLVEIFTADEYISVHDALTASGVPYVPENIRNLPEKLDRDEQSLWRQGGQRERAMAEGMRRTIKQLRKALASAPAVPEGMRTAWPTRDVLTKLAEAADILLDRYNHDADGWEMIAHARDVARERASAPADGWKLVPVEPTEAMMEEYRRAFVSSDRFDGASVYKAMIAAAPTDGREHD